MHYRGIPYRKLVTALQLRVNIYPTREFLARGRHDVCVRSCRHCGADFETAAHVIGNCPITQDARIKRHNSICETLSFPIMTMVQSVALRYTSTATQTDPLDLRVTSANVESSLPSESVDEGFNLVCLEFVNSSIVYELGIHLGTIWEGLAKFPEPYVALPSQPALVEQIECDQGENEEPKTPEALLRTSEGGSPVGTPVVTIPDGNPSCPHCATHFTRILGLIDHLKRVHGQKKILFKCSKCGKQNLKYHSIACHVPRCKGIVCVVPMGDWTCEVCHRVFSTKIGLGQHKRLAHPLV